jgi:hypothetical protein
MVAAEVARTADLAITVEVAAGTAMAVGTVPATEASLRTVTTMDRGPLTGVIPSVAATFFALMSQEIIGIRSTTALTTLTMGSRSSTREPRRIQHLSPI